VISKILGEGSKRAEKAFMRTQVLRLSVVRNTNVPLSRYHAITAMRRGQR
jgi:hypothetical protein